MRRQSAPLFVDYRTDGVRCDFLLDIGPKISTILDTPTTIVVVFI